MNKSGFYLLQPCFSNVCPCLIFTTCKIEIMVPTSSVEVSGVLVEVVIIFQEHFLLLMLSSGNKLYFLMVGMKVQCRIKSAFLNVPLSLFAGFYIFCICMHREESETMGEKSHFKPFVLKHFLVILGLPFELRKIDLFARAYFFFMSFALVVNINCLGQYLWFIVKYTILYPPCLY